MDFRKTRVGETQKAGSTSSKLTSRGRKKGQAGSASPRFCPYQLRPFPGLLKSRKGKSRGVKFSPVPFPAPDNDCHLGKHGEKK